MYNVQLWSSFTSSDTKWDFPMEGTHGSRGWGEKGAGGAAGHVPVATTKPGHHKNPPAPHLVPRCEFISKQDLQMHQFFIYHRHPCTLSVLHNPVWIKSEVASSRQHQEMIWRGAERFKVTPKSAWQYLCLNPSGKVPREPDFRLKNECYSTPNLTYNAIELNWSGID